MQTRSLHLEVSLCLTAEPPRWKSWGLWDRHPAHFALVSDVTALGLVFAQGPHLPFQPASERHPRLNLVACLDTLVHKILKGYPPPMSHSVDHITNDKSYTAYWALALQGTDLVLHGTLGRPYLSTIQEHVHEGHVPDRILNSAHPDFWTLLEHAEAMLQSPRTQTRHQLGISAFKGMLSTHFSLSVNATVHARCSLLAVAFCRACRHTAAWQTSALWDQERNATIHQHTSNIVRCPI
jgi:hypothetical protein